MIRRFIPSEDKYQSRMYAMSFCSQKTMDLLTKAAGEQGEFTRLPQCLQRLFLIKAWDSLSKARDHGETLKDPRLGPLSSVLPIVSEILHQRGARVCPYRKSSLSGSRRQLSSSISLNVEASLLWTSWEPRQCRLQPYPQLMSFVSSSPRCLSVSAYSAPGPQWLQPALLS